jgi:hypothetical protein
MNRTPPTLANWLLGRFDLARRKPDLMGDLAEEYNSGRSAAWYWWQAAVAIGIALTRDIGFYPKLFVLRAVATGWIVSHAFHVVVFLQVVTMSSYFGVLLRAFPFGGWSPIVVLFLVFWGTGWIVGRLHRAYPGIGVLAWIGWELLSQAWTLFRAYDVIRRNTPVAHQLAIDIVGSIVAALVMLLAGLLASLPTSKRSPAR